jgi:hypothetical protein
MPEPANVTITRWIARGWGTAAALVWGAFFVEHLAWFTSPAGVPPLRIWLLEAVHFVMIAALLAAWRYERATGVVAFVASVVFFGEIVSGPRLYEFLATTVPPALGFIYCGTRSRAGVRP